MPSSLNTFAQHNILTHIDYQYCVSKTRTREMIFIYHQEHQKERERMDSKKHGDKESKIVKQRGEK